MGFASLHLSDFLPATAGTPRCKSNHRFRTVFSYVRLTGCNQHTALSP